jgi:cytochrome c2
MRAGADGMRSMILSGLAVLAVGGSYPHACAQEASAEAPAGDADAGAELYAIECRGCHAVSIAPTLRGVLNRPIASLESFPGYSSGLRAWSAETWTETNLQTFLADPQAFAPGSLMVKAVPAPDQRNDLIAYLASLPPPRQE